MEILWQTGSGGGGSSTGFDGIVTVFSELPVDDSADVGEVWLVRESEGSWFFGRKQRGLYQRIDDTGVRETDWQYLGEWREEFSDANFQVYNASDETKVVKLDASSIATGTTRTLTVQNQNGTIALLSDLTDLSALLIAYIDGEISSLSGVYQPLDADLTAIAGLTPADDDILQRKSGAWVNRSPSQFWADILAAVSTAYTTLPFSMATNRLLGRTTAGTGKAEEITPGSSLSFAAGALNTIQDIRTSATPQFARLGIGTAAHATRLLTVMGNALFTDLTGATNVRLSFVGSGSGSGFLADDGGGAEIFSLTRQTGNALSISAYGAIGFAPVATGGPSTSYTGWVTANGFQGKIGADTQSTGDFTTINASGSIFSTNTGDNAIVSVKSTASGAKDWWLVSSSTASGLTEGFSVFNATDGATPLHITGAGNTQFLGSIRTGAPSGSTASTNLFGAVSANTTASLTHVQIVTIDGVRYRSFLEIV